MTAGERLENTIDLPLGAVLTDDRGVRYVFVGMTRNTVGHEFHFYPDVSQGNVLRVTATYALVGGGFKKFPGLKDYLKEKA